MNQYGSYKKLLKNSKQAMFAAIEVYNKPKFDYREEVFVILLINAWELFLLAVLSKNKKRIFQKKQKGKPYKTLGFNDSYNEASNFFSLESANRQAIKDNLSQIRKYRNEAVHYYGDKSSQHIIYSLSQSAIKNYIDILKSIFDEDITDEINIVLLPLSFNNQPSFIEFFRKNKSEYNEFVKELFTNLAELENNDADTSRFITQCFVKIESKRNIKSSDFTAVSDDESPLVAIQKINPDDSHPFFQKDILNHEKLEHKINSYGFQAIAHKYRLKENDKYCWKSQKGGNPRYSYEVINFINKLMAEDIQLAREIYKEYRRIKKQ